MAEKSTVVRAFELPLQRADPKEAWQLIREGWRQSTLLANWCLRYLLVQDACRVPSMEKLPPMPKVNLYGEAAKAFGLMEAGSWWSGAAGSFSAVEKSVRDYWRQHRLAIVWHASEQPPLWRYPCPFPVRGQEWKAAGFEDGRPYVEVNLPSGTPRKPLLARLYLRGGPEFGRQLALFRQVAEGALPRRALSVRRQGASNGCHRPTVKDGGRPCRVLVKMVANVPAREAPGGRVLTLSTDPEAFWVAELDGRRAWVLNADHVRRIVARHGQHLRTLQRMGEDAKAERRMRGNRATHQQARLERLSEKDRRRLQTWVQQSAASLAGFAVRQKVGTVAYLDQCKEFMPRFPWHALKQRLRDRLAAEGIELISAPETEEGAEEDGGVEIGDAISV